MDDARQSAGRRLADLRLRAGLTLLLPLLELSLRKSGFARTEARLARWMPDRPPGDGRSPGDLAALVNRACAPFGDRLCLRRAILLAWLLRRRGRSPVIRVGVRPADPRQSGPPGHAWVELDGEPLNPKLRSGGGWIPLERPAPDTSR